MSEENKELTSLFTEKTDIESMKEVLNIDTGNVNLGMTEFQIDNFVLNKREFPTDLMKFQQSKLEIYTRIQTFVDLYYQYREAKAKIKLAECEIEHLKNIKLNIIDKLKGKVLDKKMIEAQIELQEIETEKNLYRIRNIQHTAKEKLRETMVFYRTFKEFEKFDSMSKEELAEIEEEGWKIKSAYYPELQQRYSLTPNGFLKLPHENGGLKCLLEVINPLSNNNDENKVIKV